YETPCPRRGADCPLAPSRAWSSLIASCHAGRAEVPCHRAAATCRRQAHSSTPRLEACAAARGGGRGPKARGKARPTRNGSIATRGRKGMKKWLLVLAAAVAAHATTLRAETYPTRPITLVNVFGAGSASDTICRILADPLGAALKQPVVVEDRPGANGALAPLYVPPPPPARPPPLLP